MLKAASVHHNQKLDSFAAKDMNYNIHATLPKQHFFSS